MNRPTRLRNLAASRSSAARSALSNSLMGASFRVTLTCYPTTGIGGPSTTEV